MDRPELDAATLLRQLCVELGFCLPPDAFERLVAAPPDDPDSFTEAVFREEGLDPATVERWLWREVRDRVVRAFAGRVDR